MSLKKVVYTRDEGKQNLKWMKVLLEQVLLEHYYSKRNIDEFNESTSSANFIFIIIVISAHNKEISKLSNTVWPS